MRKRVAKNGNGILHMYNKVKSNVNSFGFIPLGVSQENNIPNNDVFEIGPSGIVFPTKLYLISYTVTARILVAAPTTIPLTIYEHEAGRNGIRLSASVYNNENVATVSGTTIYRGVKGRSLGLRNETADATGRGIPIEVLYVELTAYRILQ